jgi:hypothetical protein
LEYPKSILAEQGTVVNVVSWRDGTGEASESRRILVVSAIMALVLFGGVQTGGG